MGHTRKPRDPQTNRGMGGRPLTVGDAAGCRSGRAAGEGWIMAAAARAGGPAQMIQLRIRAAGSRAKSLSWIMVWIIGMIQGFTALQSQKSLSWIICRMMTRGPAADPWIIGMIQLRPGRRPPGSPSPLELAHLLAPPHNPPALTFSELYG